MRQGVFPRNEVRSENGAGHYRPAHFEKLQVGSRSRVKKKNLICKIEFYDYKVLLGRLYNACILATDFFRNALYWWIRGSPTWRVECVDLVEFYKTDPRVRALKNGIKKLLGNWRNFCASPDTHGQFTHTVDLNSKLWIAIA
jgi:hypothetical protein